MQTRRGFLTRCLSAVPALPALMLLKKNLESRIGVGSMSSSEDTGIMQFGSDAFTYFEAHIVSYTDGSIIKVLDPSMVQ